MLPSVEAPGTPPSVLIVDDSATTRQILALTLRNAGFLPLTVTSVQEALANLRQLVPTLVVADHDLPDDTGFAVCRALRSDRAYAGVRIIMVSGTAEEKIKREDFPGAYDLFLQKPFSLRDFMERVRAMLAPAAGVRLAYRPQKGHRITVTTAVTAMLGNDEHKERCVEVQEIVDLDEAGLPLKAYVSYPERWEQDAGGAGPPDRRDHPLQGQRALISVEKGQAKVHGLRVKCPDQWPRSLVPPLCLLFPERELKPGEAVEAPPAGRITLREVQADGTVAVLVDFALPAGANRVVARGEAAVHKDYGYVLSGSFEGALEILDGGKVKARGPATLTVQTEFAS